MMRPLVIAVLLLQGCSDAGNEREAASGEDKCRGISNSEMVWVDGGSFTMGDDPLYREEGPPREVSLDGFWISRTEITNSQFGEFVADTGYVTEAERDPPEIPGATQEMLQPGSAVFRVPSRDNPNWWIWSIGAQWRSPSGPESTIEGRGNDPVVQVTYRDALAYADWAGMSLPSEEQWEYAAKAGTATFPEPKNSSGKPQANYYQGVFPARDLGEDGYTSRAPVGCFEPNAFGLHDMIGNVWEWTTSSARRTDTMAPVNVIKGGSFLCAANYCARYRPAARQFQERDLGTDHIGFRLVNTQRGILSDDVVRLNVPD
ncbi:MAG: formylglycine-generating enzyme family protein [Erythrobacter sp.]|uniref:formylglycine-generating enzyme family protein n=1 Tax=Erythrobacter sp. TaxID=1042 RepID=UPI0032982277